MAINKSSGNMYNWLTHTWNPLGGTCPHKCSYCSTNKLKKRYEVIEKKYSGPPKLIKKELRTSLGKDNFIFVCAQHDLFAEDIPIDWIRLVMAHCNNHPKNKYLYQTKNPKRLYDAYMNGWLRPFDVVCTTIETNRYYKDVMQYCPKPEDRVKYFKTIAHPKYITVEPIMDFDLEPMVALIKECSPAQVNIGADSGGNKLEEPSKEKIEKLIQRLSEFTIVKEKDNLKRLR